MRLRIVALPATLVGGLLVACQIVAGIERVAKEDSPSALTDGGPDAVVGSAGGDPCGHAAPPPPPEKDDDPSQSGQLNPIYVAMSEVHLFGKTDAGAITGFDLDGVCTCDERPDAAHGGAASCKGVSKTCDEDAGIDNGTIALVNLFSGYLPPGTDLDTAASVNARIADGQRALLFLITNYNGRANDKEVNVGLVVSHGIRDGTGCGGTIPNEAGYYPPRWCGQDKWTVDPEAVFGESPPYTAPTVAALAYVTDYTLVINSDQARFELPFGDVILSILAPTVVAKLRPLGASDGGRLTNFTLEDGVLAGRVPAGTLLAVTGALLDPSAKPDGTPKYLCEDAIFPSLTKYFCDARDIASSKQLDFDPKAACDAISISSTFRAQPVVPGKKFRPDDLAHACIDGGGDPALLQKLYSCP